MLRVLGNEKEFHPCVRRCYMRIYYAHKLQRKSIFGKCSVALSYVIAIFSFFFVCFQQKRRKQRILPIFIYVGFNTSKRNGKMCARTSSAVKRTIQIVEDPQAKLIESNDTMAAEKQREVNE